MDASVNLKNAFQIFERCGLDQVVISPGSRNAPLVEAFQDSDFYRTYSIMDERSAAFFALGIAQQSRKPGIICCTSGSAALNYAPAISEAYYQGIPMIVLTADRPSRWIDQQEGQSIRQTDVFRNYIKASFELPQDLSKQEHHDHAMRILNEAIIAASESKAGPVHINIPLDEPLYGRPDSAFEIKQIQKIQGYSLGAQQEDELRQLWHESERILILIGQMHPVHTLTESLNKIVQMHPGVSIMSESLSNTHGDQFINCIDRVIDHVPDHEILQPDLLITFGEILISKKIKAFLRKNKPRYHWQVKAGNALEDTFNALTHRIVLPEADFVQKMAFWDLKDGNYRKSWLDLSERKKEAHQNFMAECEYSDMKVFEEILDQVPEDHEIQMGNSTVVRYAQLFEASRSNPQFGNRGTSGIDGCSSTAVGASAYSDLPTLLITGDVAFHYDSNAFLNKYVSNKLRVIVINNGGGNIFKIIEGPEKLEKGKEYLESPHQFTAKEIAERSNMEYMSAANQEELQDALPKFFEPLYERAVVLEVFIDSDISAQTLKSYFQFLKA